MQSKNLVIGILTVIALAGAGAIHAQGEPESMLYLTFGVYQSDKATVMYKMFSPVIDYIQNSVEHSLGRSTDIHIKIFKTYDEGIDSIVNGEGDFVRFGPASYVISKKRNPGIKLLAMEHKKGKKRFKGMIIVSVDNPIRSLSDLKGHRFAFGDKNSTIGRYLAQAEMVKAGIHAADLADFKYLGRHDKVAKAVQLGDFDAGSVKNKTYRKFNENGRLRILHSFDNVTKPWIVREGIEPSVIQAIQGALLSMEEDSEILKELKVSGFLKSSDSEYQLVREGMELARSF